MIAEKMVSKIKEGEWTDGVICRNRLHVLFSPYRQKKVECGRKLLLEPKSKDHQNTYKIYVSQIIRLMYNIYNI